MDSDGTGRDWAGEPWPDDGPDPDWPDDWPGSGRPDGRHWPQGYGVPPAGAGSGRRGPRGVALGLTAAVALGAGAGAVYLYKSELAGSAAAAVSQSPRTAIGSGPATPPAPSGAGTVTRVLMLGRVLAVRNDSVTLGGGPAPAISARVTSATRFTGTVRSLAQVRVGDTVTAQINVSGGTATLVRLQDPASQP